MITTTAQAPAAPPQLREIPRAQLYPSPYNPKDRWQNPDPDLAASFKVQGVLEPLIVRPRHAAGFEIVAGHRRWAAATLAALATLPCIVREMTDAQVAAAQLVENDQREGFGPLQRAQLYAQHMQLFKWTQDQLAHVVGRTPAHVSQVLSLLELPKAAVKLVEQGKVDFTAARELVKLKAYPARLEDVLQGIEYGDYRTSKDVAREVKWQLEIEVKEKARADQQAKEAEARKKAALDERAKVRADKKAQAAAAAEKARRAREAAQQKAQAERDAKIDAEVAAVLKVKAPAWAKALIAVAAQIRMPATITGFLARESVLAPLLEDLFDAGWSDDETRYAGRVFKALRPYLPGKWDGAYPRDAKALPVGLALGFWFSTAHKHINAEIERLAAARVDAFAASAARVNARKAAKPPARKGGRK